MSRLPLADHAYEALMQHRISSDVRPAVAQHEPVGLHRRWRGAPVHDRFGDREHVFVVDRDLALEDKTLAVVPGHVTGCEGVSVWRSAVQRCRDRGSCPGRAYEPVSAQ